MYEFNYHQPTSLDEVANLLGANEEAKLVAGGMTLVPTLKFRLAKPSDLVDLAAIPSLRGITDAGDALVIGAMTRHAEVHRSPQTRESPMYEFNYHQPTSLDEVANLLGANEEAKLVAGGMTLVPTLKFRLAKPSDLIDLTAISSLRGITDAGDALVIGAMTRHAEVERSPLVKQAIPALAALAHMIGDPAVRNRGTIGGSISNNDPAADYPAAVVGLGGAVQTTRRQIAADDFFTGIFETALDRTEIVTAVRLPKPQAACYQKFRNPASRYAIVGVFVARTPGGVRVAVTGAGPCVFRVPEMEAALARSFTPDAIKDVTIPQDGLNSDIHASAEYRAHLVGVMARRAVAGCA